MKKRIIQLIEFERLTKLDFFQKTGIKRGFLDSDKLDQAVSDKQITMIVAAFPTLNLEWLLFGRGEMFNVQSESAGENRAMLEKIINNLNAHIDLLNERIRSLEAQLQQEKEKVDLLSGQTNMATISL